jgi:hypothetical protein
MTGPQQQRHAASAVPWPRTVEEDPVSARHLDRDGVAIRRPVPSAVGHCPHLTVPAALADIVVDTLERTPA